MSKTKRLKNPTRKQKEIIVKAGLDWKNWHVYDEDNISLTVVSRRSGRRRVLLK